MTAIYVRNQDELDAALNNSEYTYCEHENHDRFSEWCLADCAR